MDDNLNLVSLEKISPKMRCGVRSVLAAVRENHRKLMCELAELALAPQRLAFRIVLELFSCISSDGFATSDDLAVSVTSANKDRLAVSEDCSV